MSFLPPRQYSSLSFFYPFFWTVLFLPQMTVMDVLWEDVRNGSLMDNFVLFGESLVEVMGSGRKGSDGVYSYYLGRKVVLWSCILLLYCCEMCECNVVDEVKLHGVEHCMIRLCRERLVDRVSTVVLQVRMGVAVKIKDMIIQSCMWWQGHAICWDITSQIDEVMEYEITEKRKVSPSKWWEECENKYLEQDGLRTWCIQSQEKARAN